MLAGSGRDQRRGFIVAWVFSRHCHAARHHRFLSWTQPSPALTCALAVGQQFVSPWPLLCLIIFIALLNCLDAHIQAVLNMEPVCSGAGPAAATSFLDAALAQVRDGGATGGITTVGQQAECVEEVLVQQPNASAINRQLYCGFYQACIRS